LTGFNDPLVDCKNCKARFRADKVPKRTEGEPAEYAEVDAATGKKTRRAGVVGKLKIVCPECGSPELSDIRQFNLMFKTNLGPVEDAAHAVFLRPETAQAMFVNFLNVQASSRKKPPFGIAQQGKSFRNEIVVEHFTFRSCEFEQMEMEFFVKPGTDEQWYEYWCSERLKWYAGLGMTAAKLRLRKHETRELAHYAKACSDVEYEYPWGWDELEGIANRTDYDLKQHSQFSGKNLTFFDEETKERYTPYVIEPAAGADRAALALLLDAFHESEAPTADGKMEVRTVLRFHPRVAPVKAAVFPLVKKDGMPEKAEGIIKDFKKHAIQAQYDEAGAVGRRYRRQDEIGTPFCITVDGQTLTDNTVTVRDRDTMAQERLAADRVVEYVAARISA
jgi:glycyl-tRNA synthetase